MDEEAQADMERTFRRQNRSIICRKCGQLGTTIVDGKDLSNGMPGIKYKVCGSCGNAEAKVARQMRGRL